MFWSILAGLAMFGAIALLVFQSISKKEADVELRQRFEDWDPASVNASVQKARQEMGPILSVMKIISPINDVIKIVPLRKLLNRKLIASNFSFTVNEFMLIQEIVAISMVLVYTLLIDKISVDVLLVLMIVGFVLPIMWLDVKIKQRKKEIKKELPNVIDLLTLCVDVGMDFMLAVKRIVRDYKPCALTEELANVWRQIQMGRSRAEALKYMAWRVDLPEVSSFVRALIQGDRMGTPIGVVLKTQSEEMRVFRILDAEEQAMKAPVKMLFPMFFFILPVILIIVAGPIFLEFVRSGLNFGMK